MPVLKSLPRTIKSLLKNPPLENTPQTIQGWVKSARLLKKVGFLSVSDGTSSGSVMVVTPPEAVKGILTGSSVEVAGTWVRSRGAQDYELKASKVNVLGGVSPDYPLQKKYHSPEFIRSLPTMKFQTSRLGSVARFRSFLEGSFLRFFEAQDFMKVSPPLITGLDCEGAGELFRVESDSFLSKKKEFFGKKAYLTVSTQLHLETLSQALGRVWTLSPCFRAEESDTNRHLSEFWMLEAEVAFLRKVLELEDLSEQMLRYVINEVLNNKNGVLDDLLGSRRDKEELKAIEDRLESIQQYDWHRMTYAEAIKVLQEREKYEWEYLPPVLGQALSTEHEKYLTQILKGPVFVSDYPKDEKAFYMKINNDNETVACFDLLLPGMGELIGGSVREEQYDVLLKEVQRRNMKVDDLAWYMDLRKNGTVPHGGFGMGFERWVSYLCGLDNIKDSVVMERVVGECKC